MRHIYQPVMLKTLLLNRGRASVGQIAQEFLNRDQAQLEYYEEITGKMPGRVLRDHGTRRGPPRYPRQGELPLIAPLSSHQLTVNPYADSHDRR